MANDISKLITPDGVSHDVRDATANKAIYHGQVNSSSPDGKNDFNNLLVVGSSDVGGNDNRIAVYWCQVSGMLNAPESSGYGYLECISSLQRYTNYSTKNVFLRTYVNSTWSAWVQSATPDISGKVNKAGDTMTGELLFNNKNAIVKDTDIKLDTAPSSNIWGDGYYFRTDGDTTIGYIRNVQDTSNSAGIQWEVQRTISNTRYYSYISIKIASDGTKTVEISEPAAWRSALNAVNKSGDTMSGKLAFSNTSRNIEVPKRSISYVDGAKGNCGIYMPHTYNANEWGPILCVQNKAGGSWSIGSYDSEDLEFVNFTKANIDSSTNAAKCIWRLSPTNGFAGPWNGIIDDHNTNNTTDTWVPVFTGSKMQHRVIPTDYNNKIIGESNHAASTGAALSSDTGKIGVHWYSQTGKIANQPSQYGFLLTCATDKNSAEQHSIFMEQANGNLYHMGTNGSSSGSPPTYKKIWDNGNAPYGSVSFTRSHASVSYTEHLSCYRFGNVVMFAGYFSCGASIAGNTALYSGLPKPAGGKHIYFTWSGYDFFLNAGDGTIRTNGTIVSRDYVGTFTYICA